MRIPSIAACLFAVAALQAQSGLPSFEVSSVKPNNSGTTIANGARVVGDRFTATNVTVVQLLRSAYTVQEYQIAGHPGWTGLDRFDIAATLPRGSTPSDWPAMLQDLLAKRFRLRLHKEPRETSVLALGVARSGHKLTPVDPSKCAPPNGDCGFNASPTQIVGRGQSMDQLATRLSRSIGQTVVDRTGVSGIFDFKVEWTEDDAFRAAGASASPAIFTALSEQLGLRLQSERAPVEFLVIDGVERPTPD